MSVEQLASLGILTSAVLYLLAFLAHSAEWAVSRPIPADQAPVPDRELALVGAPGSGDPAGAAGPAQPGADGFDPIRVKADMWGRLGLGLTLIGAASHLVGVVLRGVAAGRVPWGNMYEFVTASLLFVALAHLWLAIVKQQRWLGLAVTLLLAVGNGLASTVFFVAVAELIPALHSVWFVIHIVAACIAGAAFNVGGIAAIGFLVKTRAENRGVTRGYLAKLPAASRIDSLSYKAHAFAFPVWTFTIAAGAVWAEYAWGRFWGWDPKETWSLVTWVIYAAYLHARATAGWKGRPAAVIAIVGLVAFWFNFIGINLLVSGLHSYAGI